jgi:hypothetical protein
MMNTGAPQSNDVERARILEEIARLKHIEETNGNMGKWRRHQKDVETHLNTLRVSNQDIYEIRDRTIDLITKEAEWRRRKLNRKMWFLRIAQFILAIIFVISASMSIISFIHLFHH